MTIQFGSIMNKQDRFITVDGQNYAVKRKSYKNPLMSTTATNYKDTVVVNGKEYYVKSAPTLLSMDGKKDVVVINGKTYDVQDKNDAMSILRTGISKLSN